MAAKKAGSRNGLSGSDKQICDLVEMPASRNVQGTGVLVAVIDADGTSRKVRHHSEKYGNSLPAGRLAKRHDDLIVQLLSAVASPRRLTMLKAMMAGADSYAKLRKAVGLSAGPLYYHLRELKSAGLVEEGQRDVYRLTVRGKHLLLIADSSVKLVAR
jgi:DNA-binding transcriptional ArsR family regulator